MVSISLQVLDINKEYKSSFLSKHWSGSCVRSAPGLFLCQFCSCHITSEAILLSLSAMGQEILELSTLLLSYSALVGPGKVALLKLGFSWICMLWSDLPVPLCGGAVTDALHATEASQRFSSQAGSLVWQGFHCIWNFFPQVDTRRSPLSQQSIFVNS